MENRDMIRMANQIAAYFEAYPRGEALDGIAKHIKSFWDPRMRKQLDAYVAEDGAELSPLVVAAFSAGAKRPSGAAPVTTSRGGAAEPEDRPAATVSAAPARPTTGSNKKQRRG
jgi:formate dehydrogenase subunit delta